METVLVTGGNGFIGSNLVKRIVELEEWKVRVLVLKGTPENFLDPIRDKIEVVYGDITRPETLPPAVVGTSKIFHLASVVSDWGPWGKFLKVIFEGTRNLILAAIKAGVKRFVHMSSLAIHAFKGYQNADETTSRHTSKYYYGRAKNLAEDYIEKAFATGKIETVVIRPGWTIYGENDFATVYELLETMKKGLFGSVNHGKALCSFIYVQNLVDGMIHAAKHPGAAGEVFIISDGSMTWREYYARISRGIGAKTPTLSLPYRAVAPLIWCLEKVWRFFRVKKRPLLTMYLLGIQWRDTDFSGAKFVDKFGFKPRFTLLEGLKRTLDWYNAVSKTPVKHPR